jgi:hypothetical protein
MEKSCPKQMQLRTALEKIAGNLSKISPTSDKFIRKSIKAVKNNTHLTGE